VHQICCIEHLGEIPHPSPQNSSPRRQSWELIEENIKEKKMRETIEAGDLVKVSCEAGLWTVVAVRARNLEPKFMVQLGEDPTTSQWFQSDVVRLMLKSPKPEPVPVPMSEPESKSEPASAPQYSWMTAVPQYSKARGSGLES
jgi:hypothetical protein